MKPFCFDSKFPSLAALWGNWSLNQQTRKIDQIFFIYFFVKNCKKLQYRSFIYILGLFTWIPKQLTKHRFRARFDTSFTFNLEKSFLIKVLAYFLTFFLQNHLSISFQKFIFSDQNGRLKLTNSIKMPQNIHEKCASNGSHQIQCQ